MLKVANYFLLAVEQRNVFSLVAAKSFTWAGATEARKLKDEENRLNLTYIPGAASVLLDHACSLFKNTRMMCSKEETCCGGGLSGFLLAPSGIISISFTMAADHSFDLDPPNDSPDQSDEDYLPPSQLFDLEIGPSCYFYYSPPPPGTSDADRRRDVDLADLNRFPI